MRYVLIVVLFLAAACGSDAVPSGDAGADGAADTQPDAREDAQADVACGDDASFCCEGYLYATVQGESRCYKICETADDCDGAGCEPATEDASICV